MASFSRLVRFLDEDDQEHYGDAILGQGTTDIAKATQARIITGNVFGPYTIAGQLVNIKRLLAPLAPAQAKTVRCLGMNYATHTTYAKYPVLFYKPATALSGPTDPIPVHKVAQEDGLDYECELVVVIGKPCLNVSEYEALEYVLGYAVGNDVSHRTWQQRGGQWSLGKSFDGWAPYGPGIVSASVITNPQNLKITTRVNGEIVQDSTTADMIFSVKQLIAFFSQGTTLLPGDLIFTGTPSGVGNDKTPQLWLKNNDVVEVEIENIGTCTNKVNFAS